LDQKCLRKTRETPAQTELFSIYLRRSIEKMLTKSSTLLLISSLIEGCCAQASLLHAEGDDAVSLLQIHQAKTQRDRTVSACKPVANSWCVHNNVSKPTAKLLITGSGGSGTNSVSQMFSHSSMNLGHEVVSPDGSVSWFFAVNAHSWFSSFHCDGGGSDIAPLATLTDGVNDMEASYEGFGHVFQLVRCPRHTISAFGSHSNCSLLYQKKALDLDIPDEDINSLKSYMMIWLKWNEHIETYAEARYRTDQMEEMFVDACLLDSAKALSDCPRPTLTPHNSNHRSHESFTWTQMQAADAELTQQIHDKALQYGFGDDCLQDGTSELFQVDDDKV